MTCFFKLSAVVVLILALCSCCDTLTARRRLPDTILAEVQKTTARQRPQLNSNVHSMEVDLDDYNADFDSWPEPPCATKLTEQKLCKTTWKTIASRKPDSSSNYDTLADFLFGSQEGRKDSCEEPCPKCKDNEVVGKSNIRRIGKLVDCAECKGLKYLKKNWIKTLDTKEAYDEKARAKTRLEKRKQVQYAKELKDCPPDALIGNDCVVYQYKCTKCKQMFEQDLMCGECQKIDCGGKVLQILESRKPCKLTE